MTSPFPYVAFMCSLLFSTAAFSAQHFAIATGSQSAAGTSANLGNTGNDAKIFGSIEIAVNCWDGSTPSWQWDDGTTTGVISLPATAVDPDIVLVTDGSLLFAVVAYCKSGGGAFYKYYQWSGSSFGSGTEVTLSALTSASSAINIDADNYGNFAIIWQDTNTGTLRLAGGTISTTPTIASTQSVPSSSGMTLPDVTLYVDDNSNYWVNYCYVDASTHQTLYVGTNDFYNNLLFGTLSSTILWSDDVSLTISSAQYYEPRIASPQDGEILFSGNVWSVVATRPSTGAMDIVGHTYVNSTVYSRVYTDGGSDSPWGIGTNGYNRVPAISWVNENNVARGFTIAWTSGYNGEPSYFVPYGCLAVFCQYDGTWLPYNGQNMYYVVSTNNSSNILGEWKVSVAGRDMDNEHNLFTFWEGDSQDIIYKDHYIFVYNLREDQGGIRLSVFPNPFTSNVNITMAGLPSDFYVAKLSDALGRTVLTMSGTTSDVQNAMNGNAAAIAPGLYYFEAVNGTTGKRESAKLCKR